MSIGENIKKIRKSKGLTQKELGELLGKTQQFIAKLEKDMHSPNFATLHKVANALDVYISDLIGGGVDLPYDWENIANDNGIAPPNDFDGTPEEWFKAVNTIHKEGLEESSDPKYYLGFHFDKLNITGKWEAVKRVEELTELKKYTDKD